jgi:hypothetical protein
MDAPDHTFGRPTAPALQPLQVLTLLQPNTHAPCWDGFHSRFSGEYSQFLNLGNFAVSHRYCVAISSLGHGGRAWEHDFPSIFPPNWEFSRGDRFALDCLHHQSFQRLRRDESEAAQAVLHSFCVITYVFVAASDRHFGARASSRRRPSRAANPDTSHQEIRFFIRWDTLLALCVKVPPEGYA